MKKLFLFIFSVILLLVGLSEKINAIPAFARKYSMTCKTCHSPFPRLKAYGDEFAGNGFVLADQDAPRYFVPAGDDELSLIRDIPWGIRMEGYLTYNNNNSEVSDVAVPYIFKFLSGGSITTNIAYYFYFFISERGEVAGVEDAFIMFNNLFGSELDIYVGQYQVSDPLFKRELRLTLEDYQVYRARPGNSNINLTYDRGIMLTYGMDSGTDVILEILNGNGIGVANSLRNFDDDKYKNFLGRISQDIGDNVRVGAFGYYGNEMVSNGLVEEKNELLMFGPDLTIANDIFELNFQYVQRKDNNPYVLGNNATDVNTKGIMGELLYTPEGDNSKWYLAGLFNMVDSDDDSIDYKSVAAHYGYLLRRNIRLFGEATYDFSIKDNEFAKFAVGIVAGF